MSKWTKDPFETKEPEEDGASEDVTLNKGLSRAMIVICLVLVVLWLVRGMPIW